MRSRRARRSRARRSIVAVLAAATLVAACAEDGGDDGQATETTGGNGGSGGEAELPAASDEEATEWALEFTGGPGGEAEGEPYRIGFGHSSDFFPEGDQSAAAAVEFVNTELGGVDGRPVELVTCKLAVPEDGARCGAQFANDESIDFVIGGLILQGNADFYAAVAGEAAALISTPLDASDYTNPNAVTYNTGALGAGMGGAAFVSDELSPETSALVVTDDVAGRGGASVLRPIVQAEGVEMTEVFVPPTATAPEIASALQAAGADRVDVVSLGLFEQGCIAAYDALRSLGLEPTVVTTSVCLGNAMQDHLEEVGDEHQVPNGWYFVGFSPYIEPQTDGVATYLNKIQEYGDPEIAVSTAAPPTFDAVLTATKLVNQVGVDDATAESLDTAMRSFTGPALLQSGPISCGNPPFISICGSEVSVARYLDGEWIAVRSAAEGNPVDISGYLRPGG